MTTKTFQEETLEDVIKLIHELSGYLKTINIYSNDVIDDNLSVNSMERSAAKTTHFANKFLKGLNELRNQLTYLHLCDMCYSKRKE